MYTGSLPPVSRKEMKAYVSEFTEMPKNGGFNPSAFGVLDPRKQYGLTDEDIRFFKYEDNELKAAIDKASGMDFPVHTIDDFMIVEFAGMVQKLGVDGAIAESKKMPRRIRALIRCICRNHRNKISGRT